MEVLISIFVLSIGLMSLAALIPVGRFAIVETGKSDRAGACGRAGLRDVKVRRMLDYNYWMCRDNSPPDYLAPAPNPANGGPFAIDPLFLAHTDAQTPTPLIGTVDWFPWLPVPPPPPPLLPRMARITLSSIRVNLPAADRAFTWPDELLFGENTDAGQRPRRLVRAVDGTVGPCPPLAGEPLTNANYSWMVTVAPAFAEADLSADNKQRYSVSVVVFWKRDFSFDPTASKPSERTVTANILGVGLGGGSVMLTTTNNSEYLDIKENEWLMLCGYIIVGSDQRGIFRWYRVVSAGPIQEDTDHNLWTRYVTLAGPDWDQSWCAKNDLSGGSGDGPEDLDNNTWEFDAEAALMDGVVGVYTTTIEVDRNSLW